jgi:hypothetical protein
LPQRRTWHAAGAGSKQPGKHKRRARREVELECGGPHLKDVGEGSDNADDAAGMGRRVMEQKEADKHLQADVPHPTQQRVSLRAGHNLGPSLSHRALQAAHTALCTAPAGRVLAAGGAAGALWAVLCPVGRPHHQARTILHNMPAHTAAHRQQGEEALAGEAHDGEGQLHQRDELLVACRQAGEAGWAGRVGGLSKQSRMRGSQL